MPLQKSLNKYVFSLSSDGIFTGLLHAFSVDFFGLPRTIPLLLFIPLSISFSSYTDLKVFNLVIICLLLRKDRSLFGLSA